MVTKESQIDEARAAALAAEIAAAASGKINFDTGKMLKTVQDSVPFEQTATSDAEDRVTIYSTRDGLPSIVPLYMLSKKLRTRYPSENSYPRELWGRPVWSLEQTKKPRVNTFKCWFHSDAPDRVEMNEIGFSDNFCTKANIPNAIEVENHMMHKHSREWETILRHRGRAESAARDKDMKELLRTLVEREEGPRRGRPPTQKEE